MSTWKPMAPQPYVDAQGDIPRELLVESFHPGCGQPGDRLLIRGQLFLRGYQVGPDGLWYDEHGRGVSFREVCDALNTFGADFCALRERGCWPPGAGQLFEDGDAWERHHRAVMGRAA